MSRMKSKLSWANSATLVALAGDGWIELQETEAFVDCWRTCDHGQRLVATRLLKRIPATEGQRIVDALVAEARAVNADPSNSRRVVSIRLFGSLLTAAEGDDIGDVDVVADIRRRNLPKSDLKQLEQEENRDRPQSLSFLARLYWPEQRIKRRLATVSRWLSFHQASDIDDSGAPYRTVYAFDLETERELEQDLAIRRSIPLEEERRHDPASPARKIWLGQRPWPTLSNRNTTVRLDAEDGRLAQHLWQNGAELPVIANQIGSAKGEVEAYLAGRRRVLSPASITIDGAFKRTVLRALPATRLYTASVSLYVGSGRDSMIDIDLHDDRTGREIASLRWIRGRHLIHRAQGKLIPELECVLKACTDWLARMKSRTRGLELRVLTICGPHESTDGVVAPSVSLSRLAPIVTTTLDQVRPHPRGRYDGWDHSLEVTLSEPPQVAFHEGTSRRTVLSDEKGRLVFEAACKILANHFGALGDGAVWTVAVRGTRWRVAAERCLG
jgi:hypothetical protein